MCIRDSLKGNLIDKTIKVVMEGGILDGITTKTDAINLIPGTKVIMLLGKDVNDIFGDAYYPLSVMKSVYTIKDDQATNKLDDEHGQRLTTQDQKGPQIPGTESRCPNPVPSGSSSRAQCNRRNMGAGQAQTDHVRVLQDT